MLVVNYAAILPETGSGCWPQVPLAYADVPYLRAKQKALNAMLQTAAANNGATYVDDYTASIGKDACRSSGTRWVEPLVPGNAAAPFHPNARGMAGVAVSVAASTSALRRTVTPPLKGLSLYVRGMADFHSETMSVITNDMAPGRGPALHRHPYEEVFVIVEGEATFTLGDETLVVRGGEPPWSRRRTRRTRSRTRGDGTARDRRHPRQPGVQDRVAVSAARPSAPAVG